MKTKKIKINNIPSIIWGEDSEKVFIAIHGNMSSKEDEIIKILADNIVSKNYSLISFDLPEHGDRKEDKEYLCKVQNCVKDLKTIMDYAKENYNQINIFACSMGVYFSLLAYQNEKIDLCLFLSPVVNMKHIIDNMMSSCSVTEKELEEQKEIKTDFGQTLYWDYYLYVKNNQIEIWNKKTFILYGSKDNMQSEKLIKEFSIKNNINLDILENGEHFFHTKEELKYYNDWINNIIK